MEEREFNETVAQLIREARMRAGVTQEYVGRQAGLTRGSITNIESGTQTPPLYRLALIAAAVNAEPADLLPSLHLDEASGLAARHAADVAAVWAQASKRRSAGGEG
ncbi:MULTISPECIES: helix-turn-helix transcriptional regulator [unclassified Streptomyces]|uniref:helix-turn-helix domain-containing protein n=1 Tax=unclassified Streptomyces TaxID=2593676 RepID=UPI00099882A9|nr:MULTISPECIES: helix-turn-helix transcriptional regulator [unclassified Streptomyces]MYY01395.1 helix-turn-helix domain-containing protein [Streptomyces sp. SID4913]